ncbi:hypothetical protein QJS10_CPA07g00339 [Acorus calamus]|uniref:Uncharacterized protein n=1 Tax=Acorus calamus TaxID=4465 RepID=A0AAV9EFT9_ACOCL|nr:hypothetical protein QJS10_CPA07g00339 [Acorus calamus]
MEIRKFKELVHEQQQHRGMLTLYLVGCHSLRSVGRKRRGDEVSSTETIMGRGEGGFFNGDEILGRNSKENRVLHRRFELQMLQAVRGRERSTEVSANRAIEETKTIPYVQLPTRVGEIFASQSSLPNGEGFDMSVEGSSHMIKAKDQVDFVGEQSGHLRGTIFDIRLRLESFEMKRNNRLPLTSKFHAD